MKRDTATFHVQMNAKTFRRFGVFNTFILSKRWFSLALFATIFSVFSIVCFSLRDRAQSTLLGIVLLVVGLGLPACYLLSFYLQMNAQVKQLGLKTLRPVYSLTLGQTGIHIVNNMLEEPAVDLPWERVMGVWRDRGAAYVYVTASRAFILPDGQGDLSPAELWDFLSQRLPAEKLHGKRP